jgi:hypothetical protein
MGYTLYENNKIIILKHYNQYGRKKYIKELGECLYMLVYGIISIIAFPFVLIHTLLTFIPNIYIKDGNIDKNKQEEKIKTDKEIEELFQWGAETQDIIDAKNIKEKNR